MFSASSAIELVAFLIWFGLLGISELPRAISYKQAHQPAGTYEFERKKCKNNEIVNRPSNQTHIVSLDTIRVSVAWHEQRTLLTRFYLVTLPI